jgi:TonB-linked SusC/RagA family outer membrane protein
MKTQSSASRMTLRAHLTQRSAMFRQVTRAAFALAFSASLAAAQSMTFTGVVTIAGGQPLGGANVGIVELGVGATTGVDGRYNFTINIAQTAGRSVSLRARAIGYSPKQAPVVLEAGRVEKDFELAKDILNLEQVVVTGVGEATSQRKTAFAVGVVDASAIKEAPSSSPLGNLAGRVAGASIVTVSGEPGSAPSIKLRSTTSLTGNSDPLVIVDGTITRLTIADINTEDVERIEVIKGAAASSLYGSDAANGVVQIFTKRGALLAEGQTTFSFRNEYGQSALPNKVPGNRAHEFKLLPDGDFARDANGNRIQETDRIADNPYPVYHDQLSQVFRPGDYLTNYIGVQQRRDNTNYAISFHNIHETGVLGLLDGYRRQNFRINLDHSLAENLNFQAGAFYGRSASDEGEASGIFFGLRFLEPNVDLLEPNTDGSPFNAVVRQPPLSTNVVNPLYGLANSPTHRDRDRFAGNFKATYKPLPWLTAEGNVNYEQSGDMLKAFTPKGFLGSSGNPGTGAIFQGSVIERASNLGGTLTAQRTFGSVSNTTKLAYVYEEQSLNGVNVRATALSIPRVTEFTAADLGAGVFPNSETKPIRNKNLFAISTFDIKDRYIVDALVRQDASSLFGAKTRTSLYHRFSGAWRVTEDFAIAGVDELKLRASYGTAGLRPVFEAQYETYELVAGVLRGVTLGNNKLKPAYSKEAEFGFNINFLTNYTFEYTYSLKKTTDQILLVPVTAATGFQEQWVNSGGLNGRTAEYALGAVLLSTGDHFLRLNITGDVSRQRVANLGVAPFFEGPDANTKLFKVADGEMLGVIYGTRWIRTPEQLDQTIASGFLGNTAVAGDFTRNQEGYYVRADSIGTKGERPLKWYDEDGTSVVEIGDVNPDLNLAFNATYQWKGLSVNALVTSVVGGEIYNYTRQWPFNEQRDPVYDQRSKAPADRKPVTYYQAFYNNFDANEYFVEDGGYIRLRELAINYQLPASVINRVKFFNFETARLGLVGRNLWTSTNYSGYDPDVTGTSGLRGNPFTYRVDYFTYPQFRTFTFMLELGF